MLAVFAPTVSEGCLRGDLWKFQLYVLLA